MLATLHRNLTHNTFTAADVINYNHHVSYFFFFNDTATTEIYTLSLHDALPISVGDDYAVPCQTGCHRGRALPDRDRKSTRLNSSHSQISYAVFCLKKKKVNHSRAPRRDVRANTHRIDYHPNIVNMTWTVVHAVI